MPHRYTKEQLRFIEDQFKKVRVPELTDRFNDHFGTELSVPQIKGTITRHKFLCGRPAGFRKGEKLKHSLEQLAYVKDLYRSLSVSELAEAFNAKFKANETAETIKGMCSRHGFKSGRTGRFDPGNEPANKGVKGWCAGGRSIETRFKKGRPSLNKKPVGSERIDKDGYVLVKVAEPTTWKFKHLVVWAGANGPRPSGHVIRFRDGNKLNVDLNNLVLFSQGDNAVLNKLGIKIITKENEEHIRTLIKISKARWKATQRLRKGGRNG